MKINPADMDGFAPLEGSEWNTHKLRYIFLHNRWEDLFDIELKRNGFLARWLTDVIYLNDRDERLPHDWDDTFFKLENTARIILQFNHIELEYVPPLIEAKRVPSLRAHNLQNNLSDAKKPPEASLFFEERARSALYLVQTAQALGWKKISYKNNADPFDRLALHMACEKLGMPSDDTFDATELPVRSVVLLPNNIGKNAQVVAVARMDYALKEVINGTPDNSGKLPRTYPDATADNDNNTWDDLEAAFAAPYPAA